MNKLMVPFQFAPFQILKNISRPFSGVSLTLLKIFPQVSAEIKRADPSMDPEDYFRILFMNIIIISFVVFFVSLMFFGKITRVHTSVFMLSALMSLIVITSMSSYALSYPSLMVARRSTALERDLLFAARHMMVQIESGVDLFSSIASVSNSSYGEVSKEFKLIVNRVNGGESLTTALDASASRNPSFSYRRVLWQVINSLKSGADVAGTLHEVVKDLGEGQKIEIKRYSSQLNPLAMVYMMFAVVLPTMGITALIIISSFGGFPVTEMLFYLIQGVILFFQYMFLGVIKVKRPAVDF